MVARTVTRLPTKSNGKSYIYIYTYIRETRARRRNRPKKREKEREVHRVSFIYTVSLRSHVRACVSPSVRRREDAKDIAFAVSPYSTLYTIKYLYFPRRVCHLFSSRLVWKGHRENPRPVAYVLGKGRLLRILVLVVRVEVVSERDGHARSGRPGPRDGRDGIAVDFMSAIGAMPSSSLEDDFVGRREQRRPRRRRRRRQRDDHHRSRIKHGENLFPL